MPWRNTVSKSAALPRSWNQTTVKLHYNRSGDTLQQTTRITSAVVTPCSKQHICRAHNHTLLGYGHGHTRQCTYDYVGISFFFFLTDVKCTVQSYIGCTILPRSYQAAHRTTTSALVVLLCLTDVKCPALSHVSRIHTGHMRWTHRVGRIALDAATKNVMCMSMACHAKIHLQSLLC